MDKKFVYKPEVLVEMAQECLDADYSYHDFIVRHKNQYGSLVLKTTEDSIGNWTNEKSVSCTYSSLSSACRLVGADVSAVLAMVKAMNRYERRMRWQVCAHLPSGWCSQCGEYGEYGEDQVRRFFAVRKWDADCFQSTGRRYPWAV